VSNPLSSWPSGRWIAVGGALVGTAFFVQRLAATPDSLLTAFLAGCGAMFATMVVAGIFQRFSSRSCSRTVRPMQTRRSKILART